MEQVHAMLYRILDLRYSSARGGIDDEPLQRLLHGHAVVSRTERLYHQDGLPHLLVSVLYRLAPLPTPPRNGGQRDGTAATRERGDNGWRSLLGEKDQCLFETLRAWRTQRARDDAVPAYVVLTNVQLARVATERPESIAALKKVSGVGASHIERFGSDIVQVVKTGVVSQVQSTAAVAAPSQPEGADS